jgi:hypothetical protein
MVKPVTFVVEYLGIWNGLQREDISCVEKYGEIVWILHSI